MKSILLKLKTKMIKEKTLYDSKLINELNEEHLELFSIYEQILNNYNQKKFRKALKLLKTFYEKYHIHILKEDKQLYNYLIVKYKFFPETQNFILNKQKEMQQITKSIENFIKKYNSVKKIKESTFLTDFQQLGEALTKRVQFEENELYDKY